MTTITKAATNSDICGGGQPATFDLYINRPIPSEAGAEHIVTIKVSEAVSTVAGASFVVRSDTYSLNGDTMLLFDSTKDSDSAIRVRILVDWIAATSGQATIPYTVTTAYASGEQYRVDGNLVVTGTVSTGGWTSGESPSYVCSPSLSPSEFVKFINGTYSRSPNVYAKIGTFAPTATATGLNTKKVDNADYGAAIFVVNKTTNTVIASSGASNDWSNVDGTFSPGTCYDVYVGVSPENIGGTDAFPTPPTASVMLRTYNPSTAMHTVLASYSGTVVQWRSSLPGSYGKGQVSIGAFACTVATTPATTGGTTFPGSFTSHGSTPLYNVIKGSATITNGITRSYKEMGGADRNVLPSNSPLVIHSFDGDTSSHNSSNGKANISWSGASFTITGTGILDEMVRSFNWNGSNYTINSGLEALPVDSIFYYPRVKHPDWPVAYYLEAHSPVGQGSLRGFAVSYIPVSDALAAINSGLNTNAYYAAYPEGWV